MAASDRDSKVVDLADLNPEFRRRLGNFLSSAKAAGIPAHIIEAYRTRAVQAQYYAEKQQGLRPYPVAAPGTSFHEGGFASDILADDRAAQQRLIDYAKAHPEFGIAPLPGDAPHFQIAGYRHLADAVRNPPALGEGPSVDLSGFVSPKFGYSIAPGYSAASDAINSAAGPAKGLSLSTYSPNRNETTAAQRDAFNRAYAISIGVNPDLVTGIGKAEGLYASGAGPSRVDVSGGQPFSFGDFQLNVRGGLGAEALKRGIDPADPNQWQAANKFAIDQMKSGGIGPWRSDPFAKAWKGTTLTSTEQPGIVDPSIVAHGGTSPPLPPDGYTPATHVVSEPTFGEAIKKGDVGGAIKAAFTKPKDAQGSEGKSPIEKLASGLGGGKEQAAPAIPEMRMPTAPAADPMAGLAPAAQQLFTTVSAAAAKPLSWSSAPYGAGAGQVPGTTLNQSYPYG